MYEDFFADRLTKLRIQKDVSARNMSLSLGQSADYINKIENKKLLPSMQVFFNICEYFEITPNDFFHAGLDNPKLTTDIINNVNQLDTDSQNLILKVLTHFLAK